MKLGKTDKKNQYIRWR